MRAAPEREMACGARAGDIEGVGVGKGGFVAIGGANEDVERGAGMDGAARELFGVGGNAPGEIDRRFVAEGFFGRRWARDVARR